jgi:DNA polymerase/3'-5' exonuclease PolX
MSPPSAPHGPTESPGKTRVPLALAVAIAEEVRALLAPACERLEVAGSIRRKRPDVADVELVAVPKTAPARLDLFGTAVGERDLLHERCERLLEAGTLAHRLGGDGKRAFGPRFKRLRYRGLAGALPLDLFSVRAPAQWGAIFAIRTGSAGFTNRLVASRVRFPGWGLLPAGLREREGALWAGGSLLETPEEDDFFAALGLEWLPPEQRTDAAVPPRRRSSLSPALPAQPSAS